MTEQDFVGTWRLVSHESRTADGRVRYPFGRDAQGYLTYTAESTMSVAIMGTHRPRFRAANDFTEGPPEEQLAAGKQYLSYASTYEVRADGITPHRVEVSLFPNWVGGVQERLFRLEGDRLTLSTRPVHIGGQLRTSHLVGNARANHAHLSRTESGLHIQMGAEQMGFDLSGYLQEKGLEVVDKRASGGALWVVGGTELAPLIDELKAKGIAFSRAPQGGRASRHRPAWFTKWAEPAAN